MKKYNNILSNYIDISKDIFCKKGIYYIFGDLGVGKTTLIKNFVPQASSPSYTHCNEYVYNNQRILHLDLYTGIYKELIYDNLDADFILVEWAQYLDKEFFQNFPGYNIYIDKDHIYFDSKSSDFVSKKN